MNRNERNAASLNSIFSGADYSGENKANMLAKMAKDMHWTNNPDYKRFMNDIDRKVGIYKDIVNLANDEEIKAAAKWGDETFKNYVAVKLSDLASWNYGTNFEYRIKRYNPPEAWNAIVRKAVEIVKENLKGAVKSSRQIKSSVTTAIDADFHEGDFYKNRYGWVIIIEDIDGSYVHVKEYLDTKPEKETTTQISIPRLYEHIKNNHFTKLKNIKSSVIKSSITAADVIEGAKFKNPAGKVFEILEVDNTANTPDGSPYVLYKFEGEFPRDTTVDGICAIVNYNSYSSIKSSLKPRIYRFKDIYGGTNSIPLITFQELDPAEAKLEKEFDSKEDLENYVNDNFRQIELDELCYDDFNFNEDEVLVNYTSIDKDFIKSSVIKSSYTSWDDFYKKGCKLGLSSYMNSLDELHDKYGRFRDVPKEELSVILKNIPDDKYETYQFVEDMLDYFDWYDVINSSKKTITSARVKEIKSSIVPKNLYLNNDTKKLLDKLEKKVGHELKVEFLDRRENDIPYVTVEKILPNGKWGVTEGYLNKLSEDLLFDGYSIGNDANELRVFLDPAIMYSRPIGSSVVKSSRQIKSALIKIYQEKDIYGGYNSTPRITVDELNDAKLVYESDDVSEIEDYVNKNFREVEVDEDCADDFMFDENEVLVRYN